MIKQLHMFDSLESAHQFIHDNRDLTCTPPMKSSMYTTSDGRNIETFTVIEYNT